MVMVTLRSGNVKTSGNSNHVILHLSTLERHNHSKVHLTVVSYADAKSIVTMLGLTWEWDSQWGCLSCYSKSKDC